MRGRTPTPTPLRTCGANGDIANRLVEVDGVEYTWSANGNLLSDGTSTYTYNHANRLTGVIMGEDSYTFAYNGLGDRLRQTINGEATNYKLDLVTGLTQVLGDGTNAYLYGLTRIGEEQPAGWAYHVPDALGSVRQLTDSNAVVTLTQSYEPFGSVMASSGAGETQYSFTGEWADGTGLVHLRARYYEMANGRFLTMDAWDGDPQQPMSYNPWLYVVANPVNLVDPSGLWYCTGHPDCEEWVNHALDILQENSPTGALLVAFFHRYDRDIVRPGYDNLPMYGIMRGIDINDCKDDLISKSGLEIAFVPQPFPGGGGNSLFTGTLQVQLDSTFIDGPDPTPAGVLLFGHEISHYMQGIHRISIQGEVLARIVEQQLRIDLQSMLGDVPWSSTETADLSSFNPFTNLGLRQAARYMVLDPEMTSWYILLPLRVGLGLGPDWLTQLSISTDYERDVYYPMAPLGPSGM
jgi:RHS repeat-associated protein